MPIKCIIIDDEPLAINIIKQHMGQFSDLELVASYQNPIEAFEYLQANQIDLAFMDIQMPFLSGIDLIKSLPKLPAVIFTTAHRDYALESYELNIIDYLLKPISFSRFLKAINKFRKMVQLPELSQQQTSAPLVHDHLYVNANKKYIKIPFDQIQYVESIKDYIRIQVGDQGIMTKDRISEFKKSFPEIFFGYTDHLL